MAAGIEAEEPVSFGVRLQSSIVPENAVGDGTPTLTRAITAYQTDFEGKMNLALAGEARFQGARRVRNKAPKTETLDAAPWSLDANLTIAAGATDPNGGTTAYTLTSSAGTPALYTNSGIGISSGMVVVSSWYIKRITGTGAISLVDVDAGAGTDISAGLTTSWKRFTVVKTATTANSYTGVRIGTAGDSVAVWHPQVEDATGITIASPSEYVSNGVLSAPYHGAGVDGVKYFSTLNGNTVASNVVTEATGAAINSSQAAAAGGVTAGVVDASGPLGYLAEGVRTNLALQSQTFQTAWAPTNATLVPDQAVAPDGTITADLLYPTTTGVNRYISIAVTNTVATYTWYVYAKPAGKNFLAMIHPVTGATVVWYNLATGAVGTNGTGLTASIEPAAQGFFRCIITGTSAIATTFYIAVTDADNSMTATTSGTNGIYIWGAQNELGSFASSYIPTTTVAVQRNADVLTYASTGNISGTQGGAYAEWTSFLNTVSGQAPIVADSAGNSYPLYLNNANKQGIYDGTNVAVVGSATTLPAATIQKGASSWGTSGIAVANNGGTVVTGSFDGTMNMTALGVGGAGFFGTIRNYRIYPAALPPSRLQAMTA